MAIINTIIDITVTIIGGKTFVLKKVLLHAVFYLMDTLKIYNC